MSVLAVGFAPPFEQKRVLRSQPHLFIFVSYEDLQSENLQERDHWEDLDVNEIRAIR
jgi:hypothetical protein